MFRDYLVSVAGRVRAFTAEELELGPREATAWTLFCGALDVAGAVLADELTADIAVLRAAGGASSLATADGEDVVFMVLPDLPAHYRHLYDASFAQRFAAAVGAVRARLGDGWRPCANLAEELALHLLTDRAVGELEIAAGPGGMLDAELSAVIDMEEMFRDVAFEDPDFELLFDPALDGFAPEDFGEFGASMAPMDFASWFTPFNSGRRVDY